MDVNCMDELLGRLRYKVRGRKHILFHLLKDRVSLTIDRPE